MKAGYTVRYRGVDYPSTIWVFNWEKDNQIEVDNVRWDDTKHTEFDNPFLVAIFKIKPKTHE